MNYTNLASDSIGDLKICTDGSMHSFHKQHHPHNMQSIKIGEIAPLITTPIYPFSEAKLSEIVAEFSKMPTWNSDQKILVHAADLEWAEINMLFKWYKISIGRRRGMEVFGIDRAEVKNWNADHDSWRDMTKWQVREWLSLFYPAWITEWVDSQHQVPGDWLVVSNRDLPMSARDTITRIIDFCGLVQKNSIDDFLLDYQQRQQYVLDEYAIIDRIVDCVLEHHNYNWNALSLVGEAILQSHFRSRGYEWHCDGLDTLPTNSIELANIIYNSTKDLDA